MDISTLPLHTPCTRPPLPPLPLLPLTERGHLRALRVYPPTPHPAVALQVRAAHFTISMSGVVQVKPGVASSFVALPQWMRTTLFNLLTKINFYKNYLVTKAFRTWQGSVRFRLFCRQRRKLSHSLFTGMTSFSKSMVEINTHIHEISQIVIIDGKNEHSGKVVAYECSQQHDVFGEVQATRRDAASRL